ncbi:MAG: hypothetical protein WA843_01930 [Candidatus Saccharimonadales bacterium]
MSTAGFIFLIVIWIIFGCIAYFYSQHPYRWAKKWSIVFALGGPITALVAMIDVFEHTSMGGAYTRDWKKQAAQDPTIKVVSWRELSGESHLSRTQLLLRAIVTGASTIMLFRGIVTWCHTLSSGHGLTHTLSGYSDLICVAFVLASFIAYFAQVVILYAHIREPDMSNWLFFGRGFVTAVFLYPLILSAISMIPGMVYRIVRNIG